MKRALVLLFVASVVLMMVVGCAFTPGTTYTEAKDATNGFGGTPEQVGALAGSISIKGTISSASDSDHYRVDLGSKKAITYDVLYNGKSEKNMLGISLYPFSFVTYDSNDTVLMNYLFMAAAGDTTLESNAAYVVFDFYGDTDHASGNYELQLQ